jgi:gamma-glutamylputrescine oxidase
MNTPIWEDGAWTPLPAVSGQHRADVCVVGLGGSGLMAIEEVIAANASVVGIDAGTVGGGAAGRNAGFLLAGLADFFHTMVARFGDVTAAALYRETQSEIDRLLLQAPELVKRTGVLRLAATPAEIADCAAHLQALQRHGFPGEAYSGAEGRGVLVPDDGVFQPLHFVRRQATELRVRGAQLFEQSPAIALGPREVRTATGVITCDKIIVAVDGGLERLLPELAGRVRTARLQMVGTAPSEKITFPRPIYWRDGFEYWQQLPTGAIALGGFRDAGGPGEWTHDARPSEIVQERLESFLRERLHITAPITHRWAASVSYTGDRLPILEEVRRDVIATGAYCGTGNTVGRLCGRAAAQLAMGRRSTWAESLTSARDHLNVER